MPSFHAPANPVPSCSSSRTAGYARAISRLRSVERPSTTRTSNAGHVCADTLSRASARKASPFLTAMTTLTSGWVIAPTAFPSPLARLLRIGPPRVVDLVDRIEQQQVLHVGVRFQRRRSERALRAGRRRQGSRNHVASRRGDYEPLVLQRRDEGG